MTIAVGDRFERLIIDWDPTSAWPFDEAKAEPEPAHASPWLELEQFEESTH